MRLSIRHLTPLPAVALLLLLGLAATPATATGATATTGTAIPTPVTIGRSVQGRAILAYRKGDPRSIYKRVIIGQLHGNETAGYTAARLLLSQDIRGIDLWVIPTANPDGYAAGTRKNAHGVDLNRNFPTYWKYVYPPSSGYYQGPSPASEPETKAMMAFLGKYQPQRVVVMHQPLYGVDSLGMKSVWFQSNLVRFTGLPSKAFTCDADMCRGTLAVWYGKTYQGYVVTVEFARDPSSTTIAKVAQGVLAAMKPAAMVWGFGWSMR